MTTYRTLTGITYVPPGDDYYALDTEPKASADLGLDVASGATMSLEEGTRNA